MYQGLQNTQQSVPVRPQDLHKSRWLTLTTTAFGVMRKEKKRKDYAFRRQFNEKPSIIPG